MRNFEKHLIKQNSTLTDAVKKLESLKSNAILFLVSDENELIGSVTDGDIRRAILNGKSLNSKVDDSVQTKPIFIIKGKVNLDELISWRESHYKIIPIVNDLKKVVDVLNFNEKRSIVPLDCVIMAGGKGERLRPLTEQKPKPLLHVGNKPIIEHGIDHFSFFGIDNLFITTNYLSDQLQAFATDKKSSDLEIQTVNEPKFMGTIGAVKLIDTFRNDAILISNSDLLTNVDLELFYLAFIRSEADCCVLSVPYQVEVPFGVLQVENELLIDITEKPTYSYNTNGGMYIVRKEHLKMIPTNETFSAVDFVELLLKEKKKVTLYKHYGYWLDIGNHHDYLRAQHDIQFINQIN